MLIRVAMDDSDWNEILKVLEQYEQAAQTEKAFQSTIRKSSINKAIQTIRRVMQEQTTTLERQE